MKQTLGTLCFASFSEQLYCNSSHEERSLEKQNHCADPFAPLAFFIYGEVISKFQMNCIHTKMQKIDHSITVEPVTGGAGIHHVAEINFWGLS